VDATGGVHRSQTSSSFPVCQVTHESEVAARDEVAGCGARQPRVGARGGRLAPEYLVDAAIT
jgi:hypothetical protein